jgi:hypothetical protein
MVLAAVCRTGSSVQSAAAAPVVASAAGEGVMPTPQTEPVAASKAKAHIRYKTADGTRVPGVTTVLGVLAKPALVKWANNLGLQGIDSTRYVDVLAGVGTLAHALIHGHLTGRDVDTEGYSQQDIDLAENAFLSYLEWEKSHTLETLLAEAPLVSESHRFGGTVDWFGLLDGVPTVVDFKSGRAIYDDHVYQLAAYWNLIMASHSIVARGRILQVGRTEDEGFSERVITEPGLYWNVFEYCLMLYRLQQDIQREKRREKKECRH